jgi:hypothetical protein
LFWFYDSACWHSLTVLQYFSGRKNTSTAPVVRASSRPSTAPLISTIPEDSHSLAGSDRPIRAANNGRYNEYDDEVDGDDDRDEVSFVICCLIGALGGDHVRFCCVVLIPHDVCALF